MSQRALLVGNVEEKKASGKFFRGRVRGHGTARLLEELESRVLLSHSAFFGAAGTGVTMSQTIYHPDFVIRPGAPDLLGTIGGITPAQMRAAYGIDLTNFNGIAGDGTGQTVAIVDAFNAPTIRQDLHTFDQEFGLSDPQLTIENQTGGSTLPGTDPAGQGSSWAIETSLDVEWVHAIAPGANILLVLADSSADSDLAAAVATARAGTGVSVVSMSFGGNESSADLSSNNIFTTPAGHTGVTFVASTGDDGAFGTGGTTKVTQYPAASPNVVAVGGTRLTLANGAYGSETGWGLGQSSGSLGGGGGGVSTVETQPVYQKGVVGQTSKFRAAPDVAFDADPESGAAVIDSWDSPSSPWTVVGGTSLAAPMWAGVFAITNQGRTLAGEATLDGKTQTLPALYSLPSSDFHDITVGNNGFLAGVGYDLVTGIGTPIVNLVVRDLVTTPGTAQAGVNGPVVGSLSITPGTTSAGTPVVLSANNVAEVGNGTISSVSFYKETNDVQGFQLGSDAFLGTGTQDGSSWTFTASTSNITLAGTYTYYAVATDNACGTSNVASQSLTIVAPSFDFDVKVDTSLFSGQTTSLTAVDGASLTVLVGTPLTLNASNVTEDGGTIASVVFTRQKVNALGNPVSGVTTVGNGVQNLADWSLGTSTTGLSAGDYVYTATVTDAGGITTTATTKVAIETGPVAPPNDGFFTPTLLSGLSASATGTNVGATGGGFDELIGFGNVTIEAAQDPTVAGVTGGRSVWWSWTAPVSGKVSLSTAGSGFDTLLGAYVNAGFSTNVLLAGVPTVLLTQVAANDDVSSGVKTSGLTFDAAAGTTYLFDVDGYHGASGIINLNLSETPTRSQSSFVTPQVITGNSGTFTGSNAGISAVIGQPKVASKQGGGQVWFTWTATSNGTVNLNTAGSGFDTLLGVYKGVALTALTKVASSDDVSRTNLTSALSFKAKKGVTYRFVIDGYLGASGDYVLNMS